MSDGDKRRVAGYKPTPAERETLLALAAPKRRPTAADVPPPTPFSGRQPKPLPGQLDVFGNVTE